jgi:predicted outer membrane protein
MTLTAIRLSVAIAGLAIAGLAQAQASTQPGQTSPGVVTGSGAERPVDPERARVERADAALKDSECVAEITDPTVFVKSAALGELAGMELAKLAQSKSQNAGIKDFAARVLKEQGAAHAELAAIAKRKRMDVPTSLVYEDEQMMNEAAEKSGAEFDAWYARQMITESQKAVALFEGAVKMQDAELAAFARKTLPALEEHRRTAIALPQAFAP